jgi:hypothetical protein
VRRLGTRPRAGRDVADGAQAGVALIYDQLNCPVDRQAILFGQSQGNRNPVEALVQPDSLDFAVLAGFLEERVSNALETDVVEDQTFVEP